MSSSKQALFSLTNHEIFVLTTRDAERDYGMIATWIMPATLVPDHPRIVAVLSSKNFTFGAVLKQKQFALSMLAQGQASLVPQFGLYSGRDRDKFLDAPIARSSKGFAVIAESCGWVECVVATTLDLGDRTIVVAEIEEQTVNAGKIPLRKVDAFTALPQELVMALQKKQIDDGIRDRTLIKHFSDGGL